MILFFPNFNFLRRRRSKKPEIQNTSGSEHERSAITTATLPDTGKQGTDRVIDSEKKVVRISDNSEIWRYTERKGQNSVYGEEENRTLVQTNFSNDKPKMRRIKQTKRKPESSLFSGKKSLALEEPLSNETGKAVSNDGAAHSGQMALVYL